MKRNIILMTAAMAMSVTVAACSDDDPKPSSGSNGTSTVAVDKNVTIDASRTYQTIQGFAASDCWMGNW
ncbi:MAG: beta-glycosidase, partial [Duncaniella sp.]|nr:beta-glycosidase [Duncaniella sp.]